MRMVSMKIVSIKDIPKARVIDDLSPSSLNKLWLLAREMSQTCIERDGIGLHAVQVGIDIDLFVVRHIEQPPKRDYIDYFFNCSYEPVGEDKIKSIEGCLSLDTRMISLDTAGPVFKRRFFEVPRWKKIHLRGLQLNQEHGNAVIRDVDLELSDDIYTVVFQHEIDHGKNILISDIGKEMHIW